MEKTKSQEKAAILLVSIFFSSIFIFTNIFDWDFFLSTIEVDLRSWVVDFTPPEWSYQFCAGSSRSGDPQSLGFSPLILIPIVFGSFWGAKFLLFLGIFAGQVLLSRLLKVVSPELGLWDRCLILFLFLFNNFFVFHYSNGHMPFFFCTLIFPLIEIIMRLIRKLEIPKSLLILNTAALFILFTGQFYQTLVYVIFPMIMSVIAYLIFFRKSFNLKQLLGPFLSTGFALAISFYRVLPVIRYQLEYPRTLTSYEAYSPIDVLAFFLFPISGRKWLFPITNLPEFGTSEYSFFGGVSIGLVLLLTMKFNAIRQGRPFSDPVFRFLFFLFIPALLLSFGGQSFSPFGVLNALLNNSIRAIGRFNFLTHVSFTLILAILLAKYQLQQRQKVIFRAILLAGGLSTLFQHYNLEEFRYTLFHTKTILNSQSAYPSEMQLVSRTLARDNRNSYMYFPILEGLAVANCYQPMNRKTLFMPEYILTKVQPFSTHFLGDDQPKSCLEKSFFTQNEISIDSTCVKGKNVFLNFIKKSDQEKFHIEETEQGYILR